jgi:hypothetical protein
MRAADALEKVTRAQPGRLARFKPTLLRLARTAGQQELRWHLAQLLPRLDLTAQERARAARILRGYLRDPSSIVRTFALQALADLATQYPAMWPGVHRRLRAAATRGTPAMRARARRILHRRDQLSFT